MLQGRRQEGGWVGVFEDHPFLPPPQRPLPVLLLPKFDSRMKTPTDPPMVWWLGLAPATLEFWVRFPNERNQGKQDATLC